MPDGYELKEIDDKIYDMCLPDPVTRDFVSSFGSKEKYLEIGRGMVILKEGQIVAGASSYTRYKEGIEIEVDTVESERKKGLRLSCVPHLSYVALMKDCIRAGMHRI